MKTYDDRYNPAWGDGRAVIRRPEARDSEITKAFVTRTQAETEALSATLFASVERLKARSPEQVRQELRALVELRGEV